MIDESKNLVPTDLIPQTQCLFPFALVALLAGADTNLMRTFVTLRELVLLTITSSKFSTPCD